MSHCVVFEVIGRANGRDFGIVFVNGINIEEYGSLRMVAVFYPESGHVGIGGTRG